MQTEITHPVAGPVTVCVSRRSRRISISVRPPGSVRLSMPLGVPMAEALAFLDSKAGWVVKAVERIALRTPAPPPPVEMPFSTRSHDLQLLPSPVDTITVKVTHGGSRGKITVIYPLDIHPSAAGVQAAIKKGVEEAWRAEAKALLPARTAELAATHGLKFRSVAVRNTRSRWGSCSGRDDISLSIRLMMLPDELVDYIILHELCHTRHKNHGAKFHETLDKLTAGRHATLRREMKRYR